MRHQIDQRQQDDEFPRNGDEDGFLGAVQRGKGHLAGDTFNEAQKEFLIKCLEEGDTVEEMKTYASASLTPAMMQRLRQVRKKRRGQ